MASSDPLLSRHLRDFRLEEAIGRGGFGEVYRARQESLDRDVVVKVMQRQATGASRERFLREALLASRLDHPYAAHVYDFGAEEDDLLWIAMEMVRGLTLGELIDIQGPLPLPQLVPFIERVCEVVQTAHDQGLIHRDIKAANVMVLSRAGRLLPKLLDFGIARVLDEETAADPQPTSSGESGGESPRLTQAGAIVGSPHYMAPEQWVDPSRADEQTDIYALGVLTFVALTGEPPFRGHTAEEIARAHARSEVPPLPRDLPPDLGEVLARAMAKSQGARYESATELALALREASGLGGELAPVPRLGDQTRQRLASEGPQPLVEAIAEVDAARNVHQAREAVSHLIGFTARYLGLLVMACRSRTGSDEAGGAGRVGDLLRILHRDRLSAAEWLELGLKLCRPFARVPDAYPIPELISVFYGPEGRRSGEPSVLLRELLAERSSFQASGRSSEGQVREDLERTLPKLAALLQKLDFLCDYVLAVTRGEQAEQWMGARGASRAVVPLHGEPRDEGEPILMNADGYPVLILAPLFQVARPTPGAPEEMFLFAGGDRGGARLVAEPRGFDRFDDDLWSWYRNHLLGDDDAVDRSKVSGRRPYRGLAPFSADDSELFVGREREVAALANRLRMQTFVAVVGPSGAGKSSVVHAGLIPALGDRWTTLSLRPGSRPLLSLDACLARSEPEKKRAETAPGAEELGDRLRALAARDGRRVVLVVDQFEELFALCRDPEERQRFVSALVEAAASLDEPIRVVITLRDDFLMRAERLSELRACLGQGLQLIGTPGRDELLRILVEPAERFGYAFEDAELPEEMVDEVAEQPGALSLLSFTAAMLWERRDRHFRILSRAAYQALGGVGGALTQHGEQVLEDMAPAEQRLVREVFRHLITADGTRAVLTLDELHQLLEDEERGSKVVEQLISGRLLSVTEDERGSQRVEIIHEALIEAWPRLREWRREDAEGARLRDQLRAAAKQWQERGRPRGLLWRGDALAELRLWRARYPGRLTSTEESFARASEADANRSRRLRTLLIGAVVVALSAGVAVLYWMNERTVEQKLVAERQSERADRLLRSSYREQARRAIVGGDVIRGLLYLQEARRRGARGPEIEFLQARASRPLESLRAVLSDHEGKVWDVDYSPGGRYLVTTGDDTTARLRSPGSGETIAILRGHEGPVRRAAFSSDGQRVLTSSHDATARIWGVPGGELIASLEGHEAPIVSARFSPGGSRVLTTAIDGTSRLWEAESGAEIATFRRSTNFDAAAGFHPGGGSFVVSSGRNEATIYDAESLEPIARLRDAEAPREGAYLIAARFSPSGERLATASWNDVTKLWDPRSGELIARLGGQMGNRNEVRFSADGSRVLTTGREQTAKLWNADTGELLRTLRGHSSALNSVSFGPAGRRIVTASVDGSVRVWDAQTGVTVLRLEGHGLPVYEAVFSPAGDTIATSSWDGTARLWATGPHFLLSSLAADAPQTGCRFAGDRVISASRDGTVRSQGGGETEERPLEGGRGLNAFDVSSRRVAVAGADGTARVWDGLGDSSPLLLEGHGGPVVGVAFADAGERVITSSRDGVIRSWSATSGELSEERRISGSAMQLRLRASRSGSSVAAFAFEAPPYGLVLDAEDLSTIADLGAHERGIGSVAFDPEGAWIASGADDDTVRVFELPAGDVRFTLPTNGMSPLSMLVDPVRPRLVVGGDDGSVRIASLEEGTQQAVLRGHRAHVTGLAMTPDGALIFSASADHTVRVWSAESLHEVAVLRGHEMMVGGLDVSSDGTRLCTAGSDGRVNLWDISRDRRSVEEIGRLLRCRVPLRLEGGRIIPAETDPSACE